MGTRLDLMVVDDEPSTRFMFNAIAEHQGLLSAEFDHQEALRYLKQERRPHYIVVDLKDIPGASLFSRGYEICFESSRKIHNYLRALSEFENRSAAVYREDAERGKIPISRYKNCIPGFKFMTTGISDADINFVNGLYYPESDILIKVHGSDRDGRPNTSVPEHITYIAKELGKIDQKLRGK